VRIYPSEFSYQSPQLTLFESAPSHIVQGIELVLMGMIGAGLSIEAISAYLGFTRTEIAEKLAAIGLDPPSEKPLRLIRSSRGWTLEEVRYLVHWWRQGAQVRSIADAIGRSIGGVRGKAKRLGLPQRDRHMLFYQQLPPLHSPPLSSEINLPPPRPRNIWDRAKDHELILYHFGGVTREATAKLLSEQYGAAITPSSVSSRWTRLDCPSNRPRNSLVDHFDRTLAEAKLAESGCKIKTCPVTKHSFVCEVDERWRQTSHEGQKRQETQRASDACKISAADLYKERHKSKIALPTLNFLSRVSA